MRSKLWVASVMWVAAGCALASACSSNGQPGAVPEDAGNLPDASTDSPGVDAVDAASAQIGPSGGTVTSGDGNATVVIPAGALSKETTISIRANPSAALPGGVTTVGAPYTFGPDGQVFLVPVTVVLAFDPARVPSGSPTSKLAVYTAPDGSSTYERLTTSLKDATHVSAATTHFSTDVVAINDGTGGDATFDAPDVLDAGPPSLLAMLGTWSGLTSSSFSQWNNLTYSWSLTALKSSSSFGGQTFAYGTWTSSGSGTPNCVVALLAPLLAGTGGDGKPRTMSVRFFNNTASDCSGTLVDGPDDVLFEGNPTVESDAGVSGMFGDLGVWNGSQHLVPGQMTATRM